MSNDTTPFRTRDSGGSHRRASEGQHGVDPEDQHGVDPEDQHGVDPEDQHGVDPEDQHGVDPEDQHGVDPEDQHGADCIAKQDIERLDAEVFTALSDDAAGFHKMALSSCYHRNSGYDSLVGAYRCYSEWVFKVKLLASLDDPDPLAYFHDLPIPMLRISGISTSLCYEGPELLEMLQGLCTEDILNSLKPRDEEPSCNKDTPSPYALKSYCRSSTTPSDPSLPLIEVSRRLYGILQGDRKARGLPLAFKVRIARDSSREFDDNVPFEGVTNWLSYRLALVNMLPIIAQCALEAHDGLERVTPYYLNRPGYLAVAPAFSNLRFHSGNLEGSHVHCIAFRLKWKGKTEEQLLPLSLSPFGTLPITPNEITTFSDNRATSNSRLYPFSSCDKDIQKKFSGGPVLLMTDVIPYYSLQDKGKIPFQPRGFAKNCLVKGMLQHGDRLGSYWQIVQRCMSRNLRYNTTKEYTKTSATLAQEQGVDNPDCQGYFAFTRFKECLEFLRERLPIAHFNDDVPNEPMTRLWLTDFTLDPVPMFPQELLTMDNLEFVNLQAKCSVFSDCWAEQKVSDQESGFRNIFSGCEVHESRLQYVDSVGISQALQESILPSIYLHFRWREKAEIDRNHLRELQHYIQVINRHIASQSVFAVDSEYWQPSNPYAPIHTQVGVVSGGDPDGRMFSANWDYGLTVPHLFTGVKDALPSTGEARLMKLNHHLSRIYNRNRDIPLMTSIQMKKSLKKDMGMKRGALLLVWGTIRADAYAIARIWTKNDELVNEATVFDEAFKEGGFETINMTRVMFIASNVPCFKLSTAYGFMFPVRDLGALDFHSAGVDAMVLGRIYECFAAVRERYT